MSKENKKDKKLVSPGALIATPTFNILKSILYNKKKKNTTKDK